MGLTATYSVTASGSDLLYQWSQNGTPIPGATAPIYTTPATAFADSGESFTVQITNGGGTVTSEQAKLTVTARAPLPGDLRFQQVDAATSVNPYQLGQTLLSSVECPPPGGGGSAVWSTGVAGMPFTLNNNPCEWSFNLYGPISATSRYTTAYLTTATSTLASTLSQGYPGLPPAMDSESVIFAAGVASVAPDYVAIGYINAEGEPAYSLTQATVDQAALQKAATEEGLHGHVLTAMYVSGTNVSYFSYAWAADPTTTYEAKVVTGNLDQAGSMVTGLAAEGYILTASTTTEAVDRSGVVMVGTRVQGDTMPRPTLSLAEPGFPELLAGGYAVVCAIQEFSGDTLTINQYIGER